MARILIEAIQNGEESRAKEIIREGSYGGIDSQTSRRDGTALFFCCSRGYLELAKLLIDRGASVNSTDKNKARPLHGAADNGHVDVVKLLIGHGADLNARTYRGDTALHLAAYRGHDVVVQCLVQEGADLRVVNNGNFTPEKEARVQGHQQLGNYLKVTLTDRYPNESSTSFNSLIPVDPPSDALSTEECWDDLHQQTRHHHEPQQRTPLPEEQVKDRTTFCIGETHLKSKFHKYNDLSFIRLDPPTELASTHGGHRRSGSPVPFSEVLSSPPAGQTSRFPSLFPALPQQTTSKTMPGTCKVGGTTTGSKGSSSHFLPPLTAPLTPPPTNMASGFLNPVPSPAPFRRPSTCSTLSSFSDLSTDTGSLLSTGSEGSGCYGDARREDPDIQEYHLTRDGGHSPAENKESVFSSASLGVCFPPERKQSGSSMSFDSSDFSSTFSLNSLVSGPPSGMDYSSTYLPDFGHIEGLKRCLTRTTSVYAAGNAVNTWSKRPEFNKSMSADTRSPSEMRRLQDSVDAVCFLSNNLSSPPSSLTSNMDVSRKSSMTCVNIPLK